MMYGIDSLNYIPDSPPRFPSMANMSLRDWFAGRYMQAMVLHAMEAGRADGISPADVASVVAETAYKMADAMLAAREKGGAA